MYKFWTNPMVIWCRNVARALGITRFIGKKFFSTGVYEEAFDRSLLEAISPSDVVWDVGANVGHYTAKFAEAVGGHGKVYAFEPHPMTFADLVNNVGGIETIESLPLALGSKCSEMQMSTGTDRIRATSALLAASAEKEGSVVVSVRTGDSVVEEGLASPPNVIKIDVEGFEYDALLGMKNLLKRESLRGVLIEVHFGALAAFGMPHAPRKIEALLVESGFACRWSDASHLVAERISS